MTFGEHSIISPCPVHGLEFRVFPPLDRTPNKTRDPQSTLSIVWRSHGFTCAKMEVAGKNGHLIRLPSGMSVHRRLLRFFSQPAYCLLPRPTVYITFCFFFQPIWLFQCDSLFRVDIPPSLWRKLWIRTYPHLTLGLQSMFRKQMNFGRIFQPPALFRPLHHPATKNYQ